MTQYTFRANLSAARFPLVSTFQGRTVIIPQFDQNFQKLANFSGADQDRDVGIPQIFYGHNIMPTAEGFQSVGFEQVIDPADPAEIDFDAAFLLRDDEENKAIFVPAAGQNYIYNGTLKVWNKVSPGTPGALGKAILVTTAHIHGRTLFYYAYHGAYEYLFVTNTRTNVGLTGLTPTDIAGICAAGNYLIAWDAINTVYWSSVITETDFTPSLETGAGSEIPNEIKGNITVILPAPGGFIIYTTKNAVFAAYTGNIRYPWIFKEIPGSAGVISPESISWQANAGFHVAWTTAGLFKVERTGAEPLMPEITDFLTSRIYEDYDEVTGALVQSKITKELSVKVTLIATRYVIVSYGITRGLYTYALVYDLTLKRFGKVKIEHVDCFEWPHPNHFGVTTYEDLEGQSYLDLEYTSYEDLSTQQITYTQPKKNIAFLQKDGTVQLLDFDLGNIDAEGVLFLGKYQLVRAKGFTFLNAEVENVDADNTTNFELTVYATYDGKNFARSLVPLLLNKDSNIAKYGGRITGENIVLGYRGAFNLVSTLITGMAAGDR